MEKNVLSVQQTEVVEEAARIMADEAISCLPVMKGDLLVGIITETDLFRVFVHMFGARSAGIRATFLVDDKPGLLARVSKDIADNNGNIVSLVTTDGDDLTKRRCTIKVSGIVKKDMEVFYRLFHFQSTGRTVHFNAIGLFHGHSSTCSIPRLRMLRT